MDEGEEEKSMAINQQEKMKLNTKLPTFGRESEGREREVGRKTEEINDGRGK